MDSSELEELLEETSSDEEDSSLELDSSELDDSSLELDSSEEPGASHAPWSVHASPGGIVFAQYFAVQLWPP